MAEPRGDKRGQFERFQSDGSIHVDSENPNRNILTNEQRPPLVEKPFNFRYNPINSRTTDLERFTKFLTTPGGLKMQTNVALLQQSNRDLKETFARNSKPDGTLLGNVLRTAKEVVVDTIKTNVGFTATLAKQIPVNGTGTHFVNNLNGPTYLKQGGDPKSALGNFLKSTFGLPEVAFGLRLGGKTNLGNFPERDGAVQSNFVTQTGDGKTVPLRNSPFDIVPNPNSQFSFNLPTMEEVEKGFSLAKKKGEELAFQNAGLRAPDTSDPYLLDQSEPLAKALVQSRLNRLRGNQTGLPGKDLVQTQNIKIGEAKYEVVENDKGEGKLYTVAKNAIQSKLFEDGKDAIGQQAHKEVDTIDDTLENQEFFAEAFGKQLIPFSISNITPEKSYNLFFHAFLDDYSDTYSGNWNPQQYIGRGEEFYTYNNFTRAINFSFKAASFNQASLLTMYDKLNLLAGATAPSYSDGGSFMRGTLSRITIGDLLYRQTGFISSLGLSWNNSYQWEINDLGIKDLEGLPHVLDVSVQFTPIHTFNVKSDLNLKDEKYFGRRTLKEPEEKKIPKQRTKVKKKVTTEVTKLDLTPAASFTDIGNIGGNLTAISDTVQFTTTGEGLDTIGTGEQRKKGRKGGYIVD
tara:strand:+ start:5788 stop:7677 length:1890 start_codon:yes stop_codon:yes gene_type:complete